ncbi:MAG: C-type lectin domain-containing protein [Polyangiaceae bacterium]|nr:C-type lectin domain-containing protein [Polyangiaceae bacterium]
MSSEPLACFFFLNQNAKSQPASQRVEWTWPQAIADCEQLGARLASPSTLAQWRELSALLQTNPVPNANLVVDESLWIGAHTGLEPPPVSASELAASFVWSDAEPWAFVQAGTEPWNPDEPNLDDPREQCVEMRRFAFGLNNRACDTLRAFALCERAR